MSDRRIVYVIITPGRIFTFGSWAAAQTFCRRARRLPSMRGETVEFVATKLSRGARCFAAPIPWSERSAWSRCCPTKEDRS